MLAHAINTVKMAEGFARLGHDVTVLCRRGPRGKASPQELTACYGLTETLRWAQLPQRVFFRAVREHRGFSLLALPTLLRRRPHLVYARSYSVPALTSRIGIPTVAESHAHPDNESAPFLRMVHAARRPAFRLWVTISRRLADFYRSLGVPEEKLAVLPDGVDLDVFRRPDTPPPSPYATKGANITYVGHLYDYKGIPTVLDAATLLPGFQFHLVGGLEEDVLRQKALAQKKGLSNVSFYGMKPRSELPPFLWHADALLLPPSRHHASAAWTSPLKLGEYLAAQAPVVASDIPALRDWVTDEEVEFVPPDDAGALAAGIRRVLDDKDRGRQLCRAGISKAETMSYDLRAGHILERCALV